ncbi:MAG: hypothetical protein IJ608_06690 [Lachnospiraceae bacterium]|nr:hypothetical protein [Lachnospiraceae bacterium]
MKRLFVAALIAAAVLSTSACGGSDGDVKRIEGTGKTESASGSTDTVAKTENGQSAEQGTADTANEASGFVFTAEKNGRSIDISVDMPMSEVLNVLGDADEYYEAASCAFEGLDKMYTYAHYEIDTYPAGDVDKVSAVYLMDDIVSTNEGLYVGAPKEDVEKIYGSDYELNGSEYIYKKDGMSLKVQITDGKVSFITYASEVLGQVAQAQ